MAFIAYMINHVHLKQDVEEDPTAARGKSILRGEVVKFNHVHVYSWKLKRR